MPASSPVPARTLISIVLACAACGGDAVERTTEPVTESYVASFDRMWTTVDRDYSYLEYKDIDWVAARRAYRPRAELARGTAELVDVVRDALGTLRDVHVWILTPGGGVEPTYRPSHRWNWGPAMLARQRQGTGWVRESESVGGRVIDGVPYVALTTFATGRFSVADFDRLRDRYRGAGALVLDVRMNAGGSDALAYEVAGRFTTEARVGGHYRFRNGWRYDAFTPLTARRVVPGGSWQFTRPVVLLTGRGSYSATEGFVSAMRTMPNVVVVGDTTGGGSGNPSVYPLREGYGFALSRWIEYTDDGQPIEGRGIVPDRVVPFTDAAVAAGEDETLRAALGLARRLARAGASGR
jgi:hypothetical protein